MLVNRRGWWHKRTFSHVFGWYKQKHTLWIYNTVTVYWKKQRTQSIGSNITSDLSWPRLIRLTNISSRVCICRFIFHITVLISLVLCLTGIMDTFTPKPFREVKPTDSRHPTNRTSVLEQGIRPQATWNRGALSRILCVFLCILFSVSHRLQTSCTNELILYWH